MNAPSPPKPHLSVATRAILSACIFAGLLALSRRGGITESLRALDVPTWAAAVALYLVGQVMCAWRWTLIARAMGMDLPYRTMLAYYMGGMFASLFLPSIVGGDLGRALALSRSVSTSPQPAGAQLAPDGQAPSGSTFSRAVLSVLVDRGTGFAALFVIAGTAAAAFAGVPSWLRLATLAAAAALLVGGAAALAAPHLLRRVTSVHEAAVACRRPALLAPVMLVSVAVQALLAVEHLLLGRALGLDVPAGFYALVSTLPAVVAMAPISINGVGTRDATYVFLLALVHVPREAAIAFSLSWLALLAVCGGVAGLVFALLAPGQMQLFTRRQEPN